MLKRIVSGIMLTVLLTSLSMLTFCTHPLKASGTTYLKADGDKYSSTSFVAELAPSNFWALIICGSKENGSFPEDAAYMYHVLSEHYAFDSIHYLHANSSAPSVDDCSKRCGWKFLGLRWRLRFARVSMVL